MRVSLRSVTLATALAVAGGLLAGSAGISATALGSAAPSAAAARVTVHIKGVNRDGKVVAAQGALLVGNEGFPIPVGTDTVRVARQTYLIGAQIPVYAGQQVTSETLVVERVKIRAGGTIVLNARHGKQLRVTLRGATAAEQNLTASACVSTPEGGASMAISASGEPGTAVYVVPMKSARVGFNYLDDLQSAAGVSYLLYGATNGRIPSGPAYQQSVRRLARVTITMKGGADPSASSILTVQSGNTSAICGAGTEFGGTIFGPFSMVDYRTAGEWTTSVDTSGAPPSQEGDYLYEDRSYTAGRSYSDTFGSAVVGPSRDFPEIEGNIFNFSPQAMFNDPNPRLFGGSRAATNVVTLRQGRHLVRKQTWYSNCQSCFQLTLRRAGWYQLSVNSRRWYSGRLLSPNESLSWRFHISPAAPGGNWVSFPVTETVYQPAGLNMDNQAPSGGHTALRITVDRAGDEFSPAPRYKLRTVKVQMSVNGGTTWRTLTLTRRSGYWLATVPDPASGYVSLRSVVTDVRGDSSVQVIYRAFAIAS
jgi:hypothetical protein